MSVLDEAAKVHPESWWWIKADGVDVVSGLGVSVSGTWSGDVDLGDGALESLRERYQAQIQLVKSIGVHNRQADSIILKDLQDTEQIVLQDTDFISKRE